jgi:hypothetical protein
MYLSGSAASLWSVMKLLVAGLERRFATGRPGAYLGIWQAKAEVRRSNPILYSGRYTGVYYPALFHAMLSCSLPLQSNRLSSLRRLAQSGLLIPFTRTAPCIYKRSPFLNLLLLPRFCLKGGLFVF